MVFFSYLKRNYKNEAKCKAVTDLLNVPETVIIEIIIEVVELEYTYFEADEGGYIGYFDDFSQHITEGETIEELEEMLQDMYKCLNLAKYHKRKLVLT